MDIIHVFKKIISLQMIRLPEESVLKILYH